MKSTTSTHEQQNKSTKAYCIVCESEQVETANIACQYCFENIDAAHERIVELKRCVAALDAQRECVRDMRYNEKVSNDAIDKLRTQRDAARRQLSIVRDNFSDAVERIRELKQQNDKLRTSLRVVEQDTSIQIRELTQQRDYNDKLYKRVSEKLRHAEAEETLLTDLLSDSRAEERDMSARLSDAESTIDDLRERLEARTVRDFSKDAKSKNVEVTEVDDLIDYFMSHFKMSKIDAMIKTRKIDICK